MTTLYTASFEEDQQFRRDPTKKAYDPELWPRWLAYRGPLTIQFQTRKMIDRDQCRILLLEDDGSAKWYGPWAPHSPYSLNKEDAVQMLRWNTIGFNSADPDYDRMKAWGDSRKVVCEQWLAERGIELLLPFWEGGPGRKVWIP